MASTSPPRPASLLTLNNVDRVEVLKGPQGTLFGRNATGGLIQVVTRDPTQAGAAAFNITYANYRDVVADAYVAGGLTSTLAADLAVRYEHQDRGWGTNFATGNPTGDLDHDFAARTKFLFRPDANTQVRLALDYEDRDSRREAQHLDPQYPGTFNNVVFGGPFPLGTRYDLNTDRDQSNRLKGRRRGAPDRSRRLARLTLKSITAWRRTDLTILLDTDQTPRQILNVPATSRSDAVQPRAAIVERGLGPVEVGRGRLLLSARPIAGTPFQVVFGPTIISPVPNVPVTIEERDRQRTDSLAGYAQASYELLPATNLTLGGRYTHELKRADGLTNFIVAGTVAQVSPVPQSGLGIPAEISFDRFNYRVALDHHFGPDILAYVSYNTGFKSGGYNLAVPSNPPYSPETIGAAEVGLKTELFARRIRLNVSGFRYTYQNIQVGRFVGGTEAIYNGAGARIYGAGPDGELALARGLSLTAGFRTSMRASRPFPMRISSHLFPDFRPTSARSCRDRRQARHCRSRRDFTGNATVDYRFETSVGGFALNATYFRTARFFAAPDNVGFQPAYGPRQRVGHLDRSSQQTVAQTMGQNLGNTVYVTSLVEANQGLIDSIGAPRTYGVTAGFRF